MSELFLVIGETTSARRVCADLHSRGHQVNHLIAPSDAELRAALAAGPAGVAVLLHQDEVSLRYALAVAHVDPGVPLVAAIFDATMSEQLGNLLPNCIVTSPGILAAPSLAAACLERDAAAIVLSSEGAPQELLVQDGQVTASAWPHRAGRPQRILRAVLGGQKRPPDAGSWLTLIGLLGLIGVLIVDWVWLMRLHKSPIEAFQEAASVVATVGPVSHHGGAYDLFSAAAMLSTMVFVAMFTAGLVDLLLGPRLVALFGPRAIPRSGHVVVVGLGQVGLRLCRYLRSLGIPVIGVEREADGRYVAMARALGIPVVVGNGGDRLLLEKLRLGRARALAAVGSSDLDNIAVAIAVRAVEPTTHVVMRAGEHDAVAENSSLLPLGVTRDVAGLSSAFVSARLLGHEVDRVIPDGDHALIHTTSGEFLPWTMGELEGCEHVRSQ